MTYPVIFDGALERSRRQAWARFFRAREDALQMAWWAAEIGGWLAQLGEVPPQAQELLDLVYDALPPGAERDIHRFLAAQGCTMRTVA